MIPSLALLATLLLTAAGRCAGPAFEVRAGRHQLFLDDRGIDRRQDVRTTMHRPVKRGAVLRSPDPSRTVQIRTAPVWDPGRRRYVLWVLGTDPTFWESGDGLNWAPGGTPDIRVEMAVSDGREPDSARRFKAALTNEGFAVSPDGLRWSRLDVPRIPSSDEANFSYDPAAGMFIHTVKRAGPHGRALAIATSQDFRQWTDLGIVLHADDEDQRRGRASIQARLNDPTLEPLRYVEEGAYNVDVYNMGVFAYEGVYIGLPAMYHATGREPNYPNTDGFHLVQLAFSRDLRTWTRLGDRQPFIGPSRTDSGAYDLTQIISPSAPVVRDDELWFYYTGLTYRSTFDYQGTYPDGTAVPVPGRSRDVGAVCLAVLRRDGFVSLDAGERVGRVRTRPFTLLAGRLFVNVDARGGEFHVEVETEGRTTARSKVVRDDSPRHPLAWETGNLASLAGRSVALHFVLRQARLYSYWIEP
jgi:hypothetical protein